MNSRIEPGKKSAAMKSTDVPKKSRRGSAPGEYRGGGGNAPTKFKPEYVQIARVMAMEGLHNSAIARAFAVQPSTIVKWKNRHPAFAEALRAGDNETGKIVVSLAKAARGYKRKAVRPITVSNGNGFSKIIEHPVVEYYPPNVTACLAWLKRHRPEIWGDAGRGTAKPKAADDAGEVTIPAAVLKMLADTAAAKVAQC